MIKNYYFSFNQMVFLLLYAGFTDGMKIFALNVLYRDSFLENCICLLPVIGTFCCEDVCAVKDEILFSLCASIFYNI